MLEVCCAIIVKGSEILAVQRGADSSHPCLWEFPGGKINSGEERLSCIVREIAEELQATVVVVNELQAVDFDYGQKQICLIPFVCEITSGEIVLNEHVAMQWFNIENWETIDWSGADRQLIQINYASIKNSVG